MKTKRIYWIEDVDDPSAEFEHTLTYSKKKALKFLKKFNDVKYDQRHRYKIAFKKA